MAYQPPSSSKYGPPLTIGTSSPFARKERVTEEPAEGEWTVFGGNKRRRNRDETAAAPAPAPAPFMDRNSFGAFLQASGSSIAPTGGQKWQQSAIRKVEPPKKEESFEELFPSLGGGKSNGMGSKTSSATSFAELMKKRIAEEEEAKRQALLEEDQKAREREEEERQKRMMGMVHSICLNKKSRAFDLEDPDIAFDEDLDTDAYGFSTGGGHTGGYTGGHVVDDDYEEDYDDV